MPGDDGGSDHGAEGVPDDETCSLPFPVAAVSRSRLTVVALAVSLRSKLHLARVAQRASVPSRVEL